MTGVHQPQLALQWITEGLQWRGESRPVGAWPGEDRCRGSKGAQAHGKSLVQGSVDTEGGLQQSWKVPTSQREAGEALSSGLTCPTNCLS